VLSFGGVLLTLKPALIEQSCKPCFRLGKGHFPRPRCVLAPYLLEPYTDSATIFFGTIAVVVAIGACVPLLFGKETVGRLENGHRGGPRAGQGVIGRRRGNPSNALTNEHDGPSSLGTEMRAEDERGAAGRAALLRVDVGEECAFPGQPIDGSPTFGFGS
jgi:hypothetical protein